ncbi:MAG: hypothetical protein V7767_04310, partial [Leeuwenhoekiella sp.]
DVMETYGKKLTINLDIKDVKEKRINEIKDILFHHRGDQSLHFYIFEPSEKISIHMPSRRKKVKICNELLQTLDAENIHYKLN